jgi:hypothetical protein
MGYPERQQVTFQVDVELARNGSGWSARVPEAPELEIDGTSRDEVLKKATALALRAIADRAEAD